jgi:hypothetical protein
VKPAWNSLRKYEGDGTYRTLPELARQLEHERLGGTYRTREQQLADERTQPARTPSRRSR